MREHTETYPNGQTARIFIVNDTGCGTSTPTDTTQSRNWNIRTFIEHHLNPHGENILYLIILSHCHYDHILGLEPILRPAKDPNNPQSSQPIIASSSHARTFLEPRSHLKQHSLCTSMNLPCPAYTTTLWAAHAQRLTIQHPSLPAPMPLPITTLHTPGHTPDSLSWYDHAARALYVGDSYYERESLDSRAAPWGRESAAPILFPSEGSLVDWWRSLDMLVGFVEGENAVGGSARVTLSAGHVTVGVDAGGFLLEVKGFMVRVLRGEVRFEEAPEKRGERFGFWWEEGGRFSLGAPLRVVDEGRGGIPEVEWRKADI